MGIFQGENSRTPVFQIPPEVRCLGYVFGVQIPHNVFGSLEKTTNVFTNLHIECECSKLITCPQHYKVLSTDHWNLLTRGLSLIIMMKEDDDDDDYYYYYYLGSRMMISIDDDDWISKIMTPQVSSRIQNNPGGELLTTPISRFTFEETTNSDTFHWILVVY